MAKRVLISPSGARVDVADSKLKMAIGAGYRYPTVKEDEQAADAASPVAAGAAGFLRGASAGLSDPLLAGVGEVLNQATGTAPVRSAGEQLAGLREANPIASGAGEVAGLGAGMVAGPGALIGKVGNAARVAAGGKALGALASGAAEGTLYGLGTVVSEDALGDTATNAEKLASMGAAGLVGAGINVATHGAGKLASSALTKVLGGKTLNTALDDLANAGLEAQLGSRKVMNKRDLYGKSADEVFKYARDEGLVSGGDTNQSFLDKVTAHRKGVGAETGAILDEASSRSPGFDVQELNRKVQTDLIPQLAKDPSNRGSINKIQQYMSDLDAQKHDLKSAWELQSSLKRQVGFGETDGLLKGNLEKFRNLMRDEIKDQANQISPHYGAMLDDTSNRYRMAKTLEDLASEKVDQQAAGAHVGMKDAVMGAMGHLMGGNIGAMGMAAGSRIAKQRGGFMLAAAADKLANSHTMQSLANGLQVHIQGLGESGLLGAYRPVLETAAARGAMNLLATHVQLARTDPRYLPTLGMMPEQGDAANQYAAHAEQLDQLSQKLAEHDKEVNYALARFLRLKGGAYPSPSKTVPSMEDFQKRLTSLTTTLQDPQTVDMSALASTAPALAMQTSIQLQNMAGFLLSKAPKNPNAGLPAFHQPWKVSAGDLSKFYRYVDAAEHPNDILHGLAQNGAVTREAVETMQTLYPQMLEDTKTKLMNRLLEYKQPLSYNQKRGLASLFGDGFIDKNPAQTQLLQSIHAAKMSKSQGSGPSPDGRQSHTQEDNVSTQAQRLESK